MVEELRCLDVFHLKVGSLFINNYDFISISYVIIFEQLRLKAVENNSYY